MWSPRILDFIVMDFSVGYVDILGFEAEYCLSHMDVGAPRLQWPSAPVQEGKKDGTVRWVGVSWLNSQRLTVTWLFEYRNLE